MPERKQRSAALTAPTPRMIPVPGAPTVQASNSTTEWSVASFKIRKSTETAFKNHIRSRQGRGEKITIGSEMDEILTAWLKTQGVEV